MIGWDETILPVDYKSAGHILDDDLYIYLVQPLVKGAQLTAIFDSCHSGTALDLPFVYDTNGEIVNPSSRVNMMGSADLIFQLLEWGLFEKKNKKQKKDKKSKKTKKDKYKMSTNSDYTGTVPNETVAGILLFSILSLFLIKASFLG